MFDAAFNGFDLVIWLGAVAAIIALKVKGKI